jgi:DNA-binding response OmpR family regulator
MKKITILIADDDANDRLSIRDLLESQGFEVLEAADTEEAIAKVEATLPDLILLDVGMPPTDGCSVCKRIRQDPHMNQVPILMLTCHGLTHERVQGLRAGADDYIVKPCDNEELLARIAAIFRRYPPKRHFFERLEHAQHSIEAAESFRRFIVVLNLDVKSSSQAPPGTKEEYEKALRFRDFHSLVEAAVGSCNGGTVSWAGDGGTAEFSDVPSAVSAALAILSQRSQSQRLRHLVLRIGLASGLELISPEVEVGKRTSQTHSRAGHFQKYSNPDKLTVGKEVVAALPDGFRFIERASIGDDLAFEILSSNQKG